MAKNKGFDEIEMTMNIERKEKKTLRVKLILRVDDDDQVKNICIEQLKSWEDIALSN